MPVSAKAAAKLADEIAGGLSFNTIDDVAKLGPLKTRETVSIDEYQEQFHGLWERLVASVDWNRVMIEATSEHLRKRKEDPSHECWDFNDEICPDCLAAALVARERVF